jgi:hypothetical protein
MIWLSVNLERFVQNFLHREIPLLKPGLLWGITQVLRREGTVADLHAARDQEVELLLACQGGLLELQRRPASEEKTRPGALLWRGVAGVVAGGHTRVSAEARRAIERLPGQKCLCRATRHQAFSHRRLNPDR